MSDNGALDVNPLKRSRPADLDEFDQDRDLKKTNTIDEQFVVPGSEATYLRFESDQDAPLFESKELIFHPEYTNQIYREEEEIHGYKDLKVWIHILGGSLKAFLAVECLHKLNDADNIEQLLTENNFVQGFIKDKNEFEKLRAEEVSWKPPGKKLTSYQILESNNYTYEVYHCNFSYDGATDYLQRLQCFCKFYIDGASFVEVSDYWNFYIIYRVDMKGQYTLCAYSNTYSFHQALEKKRIRIAQFLVLPPFQRKQHGSKLLKTIYERCLQDPECFEITVEDSAMEFQHLRDCSDVEFCLKSGFFKWVHNYKNRPLKLEDYDKIQLTNEETELIRQKLKLTKNQIARVFEILKFAVLDVDDLRVQVRFKSDVKIRLFFLNRSEFLPFKNKKMPYLHLDGERIMVTMGMFAEKNIKMEAIEIRLDEFFNEIEDQYMHILKRIQKLLAITKND